MTFTHQQNILYKERNSMKSTTTLNRQREAVLRFYAAMTNKNYHAVVDEYLGKTDEIMHTNRLYQATEMAISYMNEQEKP